MKTKTITKTTIESQCDSIQFGYWDNEQEKWIELKCGEYLNVASQKLQCSEELLLALVETVEVVKERIGADLRSIWKRLDRLDNEF